MQDLQEVTHDLHYENYRATRLADGSDSDGPGNLSISYKCNPKSFSGLDKPRAAVPKSDTDIKLREKEAELARMQAMLLQMQQQLKQQNQAPSSSSSHNV